MSEATEAAAIPKRISGVISTDVDMPNSTVTVVFDDEKTGIDEIRNRLNKEGFTVQEEPEVLNIDHIK
jgi:copper chaperone CopZ